MILKSPKTDSWNFSCGHVSVRRRQRRRGLTSAEIRTQRQQAEAISKVQHEGFVKLRTML